MLGADVFLGEPFGLAVGLLDDLTKARAHGELGAAVDLGQLLELGLELGEELAGGRAELLEQARNDAVFLVEQLEEEVLDVYLVVAAVFGVALGAVEGFLGFFGVLVGVHGGSADSVPCLRRPGDAALPRAP